MIFQLWIYIIHMLDVVLERTLVSSPHLPQAPEKIDPQIHLGESQLTGEYQTLSLLGIPGHFILHIN